jgi:hypothetical protein
MRPVIPFIAIWMVRRGIVEGNRAEKGLDHI